MPKGSTAACSGGVDHASKSPTSDLGVSVLPQRSGKSVADRGRAWARFGALQLQCSRRLSPGLKTVPPAPINCSYSVSHRTALPFGGPYEQRNSSGELPEGDAERAPFLSARHWR